MSKHLFESADKLSLDSLLQFEANDKSDLVGHFNPFAGVLWSQGETPPSTLEIASVLNSLRNI
jgi:hypothetical protein